MLEKKKARWIGSVCADHAVPLYLDAVERHGSTEVFSKGSDVHVEKLEVAGPARAETAAEH